MHLGAEVNVVCESERCSCGFVGELLSATGNDEGLANDH